MEEFKENLAKPSGRLQSVKIGIFLAYRDLKKANKWTTALIVTVMILTFLNLVVLNGILVGLIQGAIEGVKERMAGDVIVSTLSDKKVISQSQEMITFLDTLKEVTAYSPRYTEAGKLTANYSRVTNENDHIEKAGGTVYGIDLEKELKMTGISKYMVEGSFLEKTDVDKIVVGSNLLAKYLDIKSPDLLVLRDVETGSKVKLMIGGVTREFTIKGVLRSKVDFDQGVFMLDSELKKMTGRTDNNVNSIAIRLAPGVAPEKVRDILKAQGFSDRALIQTFDEGMPKFLTDMRDTFALLGNFIGSIGIAVAGITIFIIIFVNAITRRKYIGIMKGIGVRASTIEISYIIQSLFYAIAGVVLGSLFVFLFLQPFFVAHPINFPFSDGILVATPFGTFMRAIVLLVATIIAGYIPARIVVKQNTLDAILGR